MWSQKISGWGIKTSIRYRVRGFCGGKGLGSEVGLALKSHRSIPTNEFLRCVASALGVSFDWLLTGEGEQKAEDAVVDDKLIEWLKKNPEVVRRLRIESGLE